MKITEATFKKFRISELTIKEYDSWILLIRASQVTLGSLILINKNGAIEFGSVPAHELFEMGRIINELETKLKSAFNYDKINSQMLRMVDPEVHFHIMPRYAEPKIFNGKEFLDQNWPGPFSLKNENNITDEELLNLHNYLKELFK